MKQVPIGLKVLATINFFFATLILISLLLTLCSPELRRLTGPSLSAYAILSPTITAALLIVSAIGFLKLNYYAGFITGLACSILSLGNIVLFSAMRGFNHLALYIPSMIYPTVTLLLLTLRYRQFFKRAD